VLAEDKGAVVAFIVIVRVACASSGGTRALGGLEHAPSHAAIATSAVTTIVLFAFNLLSPLGTAVYMRPSIRPAPLDYTRLSPHVQNFVVLSVDGKINMEGGIYEGSHLPRISRTYHNRAGPKPGRR
jgi:hypothetical protein